MFDNLIFSGFGFAAGKYKITNSDIEKAIKTNYLSGFREDKIIASKNYKNHLSQNPDESPFSYFAGHKMGFRTRYHVSPFPPGEKLIHKYDTSLELGVKAVEMAIADAKIHPEKIDAWLVSTVSPHEQAPGLAATIKCFFTKFNNYSPAITIASGCSGFLVNLERAVNMMRCNESINNIVIAHTETMSAFLKNNTHYVNFVTFGDAASAIVLSRQKGEKQEGIIKIKNRHDIEMVDFVGVDINWNLYMEDSVIKERAVNNIPEISRDILAESNWDTNSISLVVPHQTGNAILHECAEKLNLPLSKLYQDVQKEFGNVSGTTIPLSLTKLYKEKKLLPGMKILSASAGVGGTYGAFTYIVPEKNTTNSSAAIEFDLKEKTAMVTGFTGGLGSEVAIELAKRGCNLLLVYNSNDEKAQSISSELKKFNINFRLFKHNFSNPDEVSSLINTIKSENITFDYLVHTTAVSGGLMRATDVSDTHLKNVMQINQFSAVEITKKLKKNISSVIMYVGSVAEDAQFSGSSPYVQAKRGLHGFAASFSYEARSSGLRSIYYMPSVIDGGMAVELTQAHKDSAKMMVNQDENITAQEVAERMVKSLYIPKVLKVTDSYEGALLVRKDGYVL